MKKNFSDYIVALVVIVCSLVLLGAMTVALSGYRVGKPGRTLEIDFPDITGIKLHSEVRYAGAPAGRVIGVRLLTPAERAAAEAGKRRNAVRVTASLNNDVPPLRTDTIASLGAETLLGEKFVALSAGSPDAPNLAGTAAIQGAPGATIDDLMQSVGPILQTANEILDKLKGDLAALMPKVGSVADSAQTAVKSAQDLLTNGGKLISDNEGGVKTSVEQLQKVMTNLNNLLTNNLDDLLKKADGLVANTDHNLAARMKELRVVLENLKVITTHAKAITETLGEKPSRIIWGNKPNALPPEQTIIRSDEPVPVKVR